MEREERHDAVIAFIKRATPDPLLEIYGGLTELDYPVDDMAEFHKAIGERVGTKRIDQEVGQLFREALTPIDFPIASVQGALEKFNLRLPPPARLIPLEGDPEPQPGPGPPMPDPTQISLPGGLPSSGSATVGGPVWSSYAGCMATCEAKLWACRRSADPTDPGSHRGLAKCIGEVISCRFNCS